MPRKREREEGISQQAKMRSAKWLASTRRPHTSVQDDWATPRTFAPPQPFIWWVAQANQVTGTCEKCEGPIEGVYVPPTQGSEYECAVVAHCRVCGQERMILAGSAGVPYTDQTRGELIPKGRKKKRVHRQKTLYWHGKVEEIEE